MNIMNIGKYKGKPFAVSGTNGVGNVETLLDGQWSDVGMYPFAQA